jgi:Ca2+/Na+ antiporter
VMYWYSNRSTPSGDNHKTNDEQSGLLAEEGHSIHLLSYVSLHSIFIDIENRSLGLDELPEDVPVIESPVGPEPSEQQNHEQFLLILKRYINIKWIVRMFYLLCIYPSKCLFQTVLPSLKPSVSVSASLKPTLHQPAVVTQLQDTIVREQLSPRSRSITIETKLKDSSNSIECDIASESRASVSPAARSSTSKVSLWRAIALLICCFALISILSSLVVSLCMKLIALMRWDTTIIGATLVALGAEVL